MPWLVLMTSSIPTHRVLLVAETSAGTVCYKIRIFFFFFFPNQSIFHFSRSGTAASPLHVRSVLGAVYTSNTQLIHCFTLC